MKIDDYFIESKKWTDWIRLNRSRVYDFYKLTNKDYHLIMAAVPYSIFLYKTFPNIQCVHRVANYSKVVWELNARTGKLSISPECNHHLNSSFKEFYNMLVIFERKRDV